MRSLLNRAFSGLLAVLLGLGAFPVTSMAQHGGEPRHCPSTPTLILGGDPTNCMYDGDVDLTSDALQSFEGAITASGAIRITGTTPINPTGDLILEGDIIILDAPINTNGDLTLNGDIITLNEIPSAGSVTLNSRGGSLILDPNQVTTIIDIATAGTTSTPTFTLNADSSLTLNADSTPITIPTGITRTPTPTDDINIADRLATLSPNVNNEIQIIGTTTSMITINERQPLAVGSTISTDAGILPIRAGDLILNTATSSSPARLFILSEGQSLTAGSTLTATDGTTFTLSEGDELILTSSTFSTTPIDLTGIDILELVDINGNPITLQATEEDTNNPTADSNNSSTGAIVGGISGGVVLLTSVAYWLWPSDKAPLAQFQAFNADAYLPARQWIGMEHALTENIKFAVGSFWLSDGTVNTITPSMDNTGVDVRLSLAPRGFGEFSFSAAAYNYKDADSQYKEDGTTTDLFLDNFQVSNERLEFGYALGLQWRASF